MASRFYGCIGTIHYEFEWLTVGYKPKTNQAGTSGFTKVVSRSCGEGGAAVGTALRVHRCTFNPCVADYPANKYGCLGLPLHVQPSDWRPPEEPAEAAGPPLAEAAVADGVDAAEELQPEIPPAPPAECAPADEAEGAEGSLPVTPTPPPAAPSTPPPLPGEPARQSLQPLFAAAPLPAAPLDAVASQPDGKANAEGVPLAQLSESRVLSKVLQLARNIRRPRSYVGYSALVLFALARKCRPCVWEGGNRIDLVSSYSTWAIGHCAKRCVVDAVCCCLVPAVAGGYAEMVPVSETCPLDACSHFIAAVPMADVLPVQGHSIDAFYSAKGLALLGTVADGDCGIDVACQMLGLPQTAAQRLTLREEPEHCERMICVQFKWVWRDASHIM